MAAANSIKICSVTGCDRVVKARGWCTCHYKRWALHGDPEAGMIVGDNNARFESKIERVPFSDCEYWVGSTLTDRNGRDLGYGKWGYSVDGKRVHTSAHRYQWERHNGPIPDRMQVLHTCHQGHNGCVALRHLKLGTHADNMRDKAMAGSVKGAKHPSAKLTDADVIAIRERRESGETLQSIADDYGVDISNIGHIVSRKTWRHL